MTHHIFGGLFQRMVAEHSLPGVGENSRTAKSPVVPAGDEAPSTHHTSTQAAGHALGQEGVSSEHPRMQCLLPDNISVWVSVERASDWPKKPFATSLSTI